jgi:hypothetical protein
MSLLRLFLVHFLVIVGNHINNQVMGVVNGQSIQPVVHNHGAKEEVLLKLKNHLNLFLFDVVLSDEEPAYEDDTLQEGAELHSEACVGKFVVQPS